tara:strand:- start:807 stop:1376 length:570 start_codon:yes stop_codon:yes gene_type:complete
MAGICTIYKSRSFGPRWSGTKELAAYFTSVDGKGLGGGSSEVIGNGGTSTYSVLIDPMASVKTQTADADIDTIYLDMNKYKNIAVYIVNSADTEGLTAQIWSCPPQPTVADRDAAAAIITTGAAERLNAAAAAFDYGWTQEGSDITIAAGANDISKLTATGGMIAVAVKADGAFEAADACKVYVVGEFA